MSGTEAVTALMAKLKGGEITKAEFYSRLTGVYQTTAGTGGTAAQQREEEEEEETGATASPPALETQDAGGGQEETGLPTAAERRKRVRELIAAKKAAMSSGAGATREEEQREEAEEVEEVEEVEVEEEEEEEEEREEEAAESSGGGGGGGGDEYEWAWAGEEPREKRDEGDDDLLSQYIPRDDGPTPVAWDGDALYEEALAEEVSGGWRDEEDDDHSSGAGGGGSGELYRREDAASSVSGGGASAGHSRDELRLRWIRGGEGDDSDGDGESRGGGGPRLYEAPSGSGGFGSSGGGGASVFERLAASGTASSRRAAAAWAADSEESKCTFSPDIGGGGGGGGKGAGRPRRGTFYERATAWEERKQRRRRQEAARAREEEEEAECTFRPRVNEASREMVAGMSEASRQRVFRQRAEYRAKMARIEVQRQREEEFRSACTFSPKLNARSLRMGADGHRPLHRHETVAMLSRQGRLVDPSLRACTFAPRVNELQPQMAAAKQYLEESAWDRLSRPKLVAPPLPVTRSEERIYIAADDFDRRREREEDAPPPPELTAFLARQQFMDDRRRQRLLDVQRDAEEGFHRPRLNKKSLDMVERSGDATFYERLEHSVRQRQFTRSGARPPPDCSFRPAITKRARRRRPRTSAELSTGDRLRREARIKQAQLRAHRRELSEATFAPAVRDTGTPGRLQLAASPDTLIDRLREQREAEDELKSQARAARAETEARECSFRPDVRPAPEYVRRLASAHRRNKQARKSESEKKAGAAPASRPGWR